MCLIVASEDGNLINLDDLEIAYNNNPDGAGVMWFDEGRVHQLHTVPKTFAEVRDLARHVAGMPHAMHLRYCTRGKVNHENCHPFTVLNKDVGDEHDLALMHNGTFQWINITEEQKKLDWSDTAAFAGRLQKNLREQKNTSKIQLDHIFDAQVVDRMSKRISTWNKVVFLDSNGRWSYMNKSQGETRHGMWYSNTYSLKVGYRDKQTAHHGPSSGKYTYYSTGSSGTTTATTYTPATNSTTTTTSNNKPISRVKGKVVTTFQRCGLDRNFIYMINSDGTADDYVMVDPTNMCFVKSQTRLGKTERKKLRNWLANEKKLNNLRAEKKYERSIKTDTKGRQIVTVGTKANETSSAPTNEIDKRIEELRSTATQSAISTSAFVESASDTEDTIPLGNLAEHFANFLG